MIEGAAATYRVVACVAMPVAVAVNVVVPCATQFNVKVEDWSCPAAITTLLVERVALVGSATVSATTTPPVGAASESRIRRVVVVVAYTLIDPAGSKLIVTVLDVATVVVPTYPVALAATVVVPAATPTIVALVEFDPAGIVTVALTVAIPVLTVLA